LNEPHSSVDQTWCVPGTNDILWAEWDGDFIAFHRPSGKTHLLNAASQALLSRILVAPKTTHDILRELASGDSGAHEASLVAAIDDLLARLEELGLIVSS